MIVLGIDPGYERVGISVLKKDTKEENLLYSACIKTKAGDVFTKRITSILKEILIVIKKYKPEILAIENLFFNTNQKTVMRVSEVRGAIIERALSKGLKVYEFTPLQIKIAVTGYGRSDKKQVISMIKSLIKIDREIATDDEYDAIAVGLTFLASYKMNDLVNGDFN